jgi:CAAX protease family protein
MVFGLPVIALVLGLIFGGSLHTTDLGLVLIKQFGSIVLAVVVINLWEETVWAGFFQTRLEVRFNFAIAAVLTHCRSRVSTSRCCSWMIICQPVQYC